MKKDSKYYKEARKKILSKRKPYQKKRVIIPVLTGILFILASIFGVIYSTFYQTTDDAFVEAHTIYLSPKISGQIVELFVDDNTAVEQGQIIAQIDSKDYQIAVNDAQARLQKAQADFNSSKSDIDKINAITKQTKNDIDSAKSKLEYANSDYYRYKNAYKDGSVTKQDLDNATKNLEVARSQYLKAQEALKASNNELRATISKKSSKYAEIKRLKAQLDAAELNLSYTTIVSPKKGTITNKNVEIGTWVEKAHPILSIVPNDCYIIANFKETQIANMKKGQKVIIKIDTYKGKTFKGTLDSIQRSSGAKTSLFPPENAVGSYVKVVQRVPVKITFDEDITNYNIVPGLSVVAKVRVK